MGYRISGAANGTDKVSVTVSDAESALATMEEYLEAGWSGIVVTDLEGNSVKVEELSALCAPHKDLE